MHTLKHLIWSLSSSFASMLPTHRKPWGLWPPELLALPIAYQWREIFQHFSSLGSTMKKGGREFYRLSLYMHKEVLFTPSLQWKKMKCSNVELSHSTLLSKVNHLVCLYRKWEDCCLRYEVWVTLWESISLHWWRTKPVTQFRPRHILQADESW